MTGAAAGTISVGMGDRVAVGVAGIFVFVAVISGVFVGDGSADGV